MSLRLDPDSALNHLPQPLVIVTAGDFEKPSRRGGMTAAWVSRVSMSPPLIMVSIAPSRYTLELLRENGEFAVNIVGGRLEKAAYGVFGSKTGRGRDKIAESRVKARRGGENKSPIA
ncbi:MAG: flavin reductase family protein [Thermoproteota archaeon]